MTAEWGTRVLFGIYVVVGSRIFFNCIGLFLCVFFMRVLWRLNGGNVSGRHIRNSVREACSIACVMHLSSSEGGVCLLLLLGRVI